MKMRSLIVLTLIAALFTGCAGRPETTRSASLEGEIRTVTAIKKLKVAAMVVARGTMVEKCPVAGCWFKLHDHTGVIKVDLKATNSTVVNVPLNTEVTVRGKVAPDGGGKMIQATSAAF